MNRIGPKWLPEDKYEEIQRLVPIACVDVLPIKKAKGGNFEMGLICRDTPHQGRRWALIGGRVYRNESLRVAIKRHVREALGKNARCIETPDQPLFVAEYFSRPKEKGSPFDPRKHAIGLTFAVQIRGPLKPRGEALDFRWFNRQQLPHSGITAFGHERTILECIRMIDAIETVARYLRPL
jgi:ADP-ribose pyrophosphatase YjhB (NUDIX family)